MGALSGNRLRPNAECSCYRSRLVDPLNARLPDKTPPRRGKWGEPSCPEHLARFGATTWVRRRPTRRVGRRSVVPTKLAEPATQPSTVSAYNGPTEPSTAPAQLSIVSTYDGPTPSPRLEGGLSVNQALGVSPWCQIGAINRVRPRKVGGQTAYRAAAKVSTGTESKPQRVGATRPPVRPGRDGAEGGRGVGSHDSQGFATHHVRMTEPRFEGTPILLTCKARPAAPLRSWLTIPRPPG